jgi:hypothetical protein
MLNKKWPCTLLCAGALLLFGARQAEAALTITGTVSAGKYLVTGSTVHVTANTVFKISFETLTPGENLSLCAGTTADFVAGNCATQLVSSGGPGFRFLAIVDAASLNGKQLYVIRNVGLNPGSFSVTIE